MTTDFDSLLEEASRLPFSGWDFSPIRGRWRSNPTPWNYREIGIERMGFASSVLDLGTGGGELLASLAPLPQVAYATEGYPPNLEVASRRLGPLGVRVLPIGSDQHIALPGESVDLVLCHHERFSGGEVRRVLTRRGQFVTQQVGVLNHREFRDQFGVRPERPYNDVSSAKALARQIEEAGLRILSSREAIETEDFLDVGALVYFLRAAPWEVPGFDTVEMRDVLRNIHDSIQDGPPFRVTRHRLLVLALKPDSG